jgi:GrpB-like predicted nucleotidyltransferase (UPF0157 family)
VVPAGLISRLASEAGGRRPGGVVDHVELKVHGGSLSRNHALPSRNTQRVTTPPTGWRDQEVSVVAYDPAWPLIFEVEAALLDAAIGPWISGGVHHVGSTSVPGLMAKPVIDILVGVESLAGSRACVELLGPLHYLHAPYRIEEMHWFCKPDPAARTHHLHLVPTDSQRYRDELAFRDCLRADPDRARTYADLKVRLAEEHRHDREAYTEGKADFIRETLRRANRPAV